MSAPDLTEHLSLAIKLNAEVDRLCALLDEKDARIAALEAELAEKGREVDEVRCLLDESVRLGKYYVKARVYGAIAAMYQSVLEKTDTDAAREALARRHENRGGVPTAAVEAIGELLDAAEMRDEAMQHHAEMVNELFSTKADRDRERSRREALEREVRELPGYWETCAEMSDAHGSGDPAHDAFRSCAFRLRAILDRAAKDSTGSGSGDAAHRETAEAAISEAVSANSTQPKPRRDSAETCAECGGPLFPVKSGLQFTVCGTCFERLYPSGANPIEPRPSLSEAHLAELLQLFDTACRLALTALAGPDRAGVLKREAMAKMHAAFYRAAAVRRGES